MAGSGNGGNGEKIAKVAEYLDQKDIAFEQIDEKTLVVPYEIDGKFFKPIITIQGKWLLVSALIIDADALPSNDDAYLRLLYAKILQATHDLHEINYDIDENGSLYVSCDMKYDITDYDNFFSEFFAIPSGIKYFMEKIAPTMDPKIEVTGCIEET
jgi:hypothetical protein